MLFRLSDVYKSYGTQDVLRGTSLQINPGEHVGLLGQHVHFDPGSTVHESALAAFGHLQQIEHEMHELEHRMGEAGDNLEKILERYSDLQHQFELEGGFEYTAKAEAILLGLGFSKEMWPLDTAI